MTNASFDYLLKMCVKQVRIVSHWKYLALFTIVFVPPDDFLTLSNVNSVPRLDVDVSCEDRNFILASDI